MMGQRSVYNACRPEVHDVLRRWRTLAESYDPPRVLDRRDVRARTRGVRVVLRRRRRAEPRVQLHADARRVRRADELRDAIENAERLAARERVAGVDGRQPRQPPLPDPLVRDDDPRTTRAAMVMLMGLRGTPFLYYGDEIGMIDTDVPAGPHPRPGRQVPRRAHGPRPRAHADAVDGRAGRRLLRAGRRAVAAVRRLRERATSTRSATIPTRCCR